MSNDKVLWRAFVLMLTAGLSSIQAKSYDRYQVVKIGPVMGDEQMAIVQELQDQCDDDQIIMMDAYVVNAMFRPVLLALAPGLVNGIKASLRSQGIAVKVVTPNLQVELDANKQANDEARLRAHDKKTGRRVIPRYGYYRLSDPWKCLLEMARGKNWRKWAKHIMADPNWRTYICSGIPKSWKGIPLQPDYFFNTTEIDEWMEEVGRSSRIAKVCSIGYSYEGRETPIIKINDGRRRLPVVWIDAGVHAREWLSVSTALYLIHRILFGKDRDAMYLRNNFRWYIVPNANPDGYDFTWKDDRMWRKTRAPVTEQCIGTDINRNFDFHWGQFGASMNPCSPIYRGAGPFSEVETRNLRDAIWSIRTDAKLLLNLHTYDQTWLLPYLGLDETPPDYDELEDLALEAVDSLKKVHGLTFRVGRLSDFYGFKLSGTEIDWAKSSAQIKYSYTPELRPAKKSEGGFQAPTSFIIPSGEEVFAAVVTCCRHIAWEWERGM